MIRKAQGLAPFFVHVEGSGLINQRSRDAASLLAFIALCLAVAAAGGAVTASSVGTWYAGLAKPAFNPPNWVFAPVWTALYLMMAVAAWRVWRRRGAPLAHPALAMWALQLALNLCWSHVFFGARLIGAALAEIAVLLAAIAVTLAERNQDGQYQAGAVWLRPPTSAGGGRA